MKKQWISSFCLLCFVVFASAGYAQQAWQTTGNTANLNDSDFIGTVNNTGLNFKVANVRAGRIDNQGRVFFGYGAGNVNGTPGTIAIGFGALANVGSLNAGNIAVGGMALNSNSMGNYNTAIGDRTLQQNWAGDGNTGTGGLSLHFNYSGDENTANGVYSLEYNYNGNYNTGIGAHSLFSNISGNNNTGVGWGSLRRNTTGNENAATGYSALHENTIGEHNTANGAYALHSNTSGNNNTGIGWSALRLNTTGYENTGIGGWSLYSNTSGMANTATGMFSLNLNTTGSYNTSQGWNTLSHNQTGSENLASGVWSMYWNTSGYRNCAVGAGSLSSNTIGWANTAMGYYAMTGNTKGHGNVAYGYRSLYANVIGNDNTALGNQAFLNGTTYNNSSAIGYQAQPQGSNEVVLGNSSIIRLRCNTATITTGSDKRIKDNVQENVPGLEFIQKLRPVTYHLNVDKLNAILEVNDSSVEASKYDVEKKQMTGFIAQEVEQAARKCNFEFSGVDQPEKEGGLYGLRYSEFVVPLVKATQELNAHDENQNEVIDAQKALIDALQARLEKLEAQVNGCCALTPDKADVGGNSLSLPNSARLDQNAPNPFQDQTVIHYFVAEAQPNTFIRVVTLEGNEIGHYPILDKGEGQISISGNSLSEGLYFYELYINGQKFATRKMVLTK